MKEPIIFYVVHITTPILPVSILEYFPPYFELALFSYYCFCFCLFGFTIMSTNFFTHYYFCASVMLSWYTLLFYEIHLLTTLFMMICKSSVSAENLFNWLSILNGIEISYNDRLKITIFCLNMLFHYSFNFFLISILLNTISVFVFDIHFFLCFLRFLLLLQFHYVVSKHMFDFSSSTC